MMKINLICLPENQKHSVEIPEEIETIADLIEYLRKLFQLEGEINLRDEGNFRFLETGRVEDLPWGELLGLA